MLGLELIFEVAELEKSSSKPYSSPSGAQRHKHVLRVITGIEYYKEKFGSIFDCH